MRKRLALLAAAALAAGPSAADAQRVPTPGPRPETTALAKRLIAESGDPSQLRDVSGGSVATIRHLPSGLRCSFEVGSLNGLGMTPADKPGGGIACFTVGMRFVEMLSAKISDPPATPDEVADNAVAAIRKRFPDTIPYSGETPQRGRGNPSVVVRRMEFGEKVGPPSFHWISVAVVGPWTIKLETTGSLEDAIAADSRADLQMWAAVKDVSAR